MRLEPEQDFPLVPRLPYVSFAAFQNFLAECSWSGIPDSLDLSAFPNTSPSIRSQLLPSLRALGLVDGLHATPALKQLASTWGKRSYASALDALMRNTYDFLIGVDLGSITPTQLSMHFARAGYAATVQTRAITFFLNACGVAGWPVGPRLTFGRRASPKARPAAVEAPSARRVRSGSPEASHRLALTERIIEKFPDFDPTWSARERASWHRHLSEAIKAVNGSRGLT